MTSSESIIVHDKVTSHKLPSIINTALQCKQMHLFLNKKKGSLPLYPPNPPPQLQKEEDFFALSPVASTFSSNTEKWIDIFVDIYNKLFTILGNNCYYFR